MSTPRVVAVHHPHMKPQIFACIIGLACMWVFPGCSSTSQSKKGPRAALQSFEDVSLRLEMPRSTAKAFDDKERRREIMQAAFTKRPRAVGTPGGALVGLHCERPTLVYSTWEVGRRSRDRLLVLGSVCYCSKPSVNVWPVLSVPLEPRFTQYLARAEVHLLD
jgi:hypothetical protein